MSLLQQLKFDEKGLIAAITRDADTGEVLMMAWMNAESVQKTLETGKMHYWSRSRQQLWFKGETSGHVQHVKSMRLDCDGDVLLVDIDQVGAACHTGTRSCFNRILAGGSFVARDEKNDADDPLDAQDDILQTLYSIVQKRRQQSPDTSYVASLFDKGLDKILGKIGEEATEVAVAGKGGQRDEIVSEMADLWFHCLVLMGRYDLPPAKVYAELRRRFGLSGLEEKAQRDK